MASIRKRGSSYQITVSNGRDLTGKQLIETATWLPDPEKTERQNRKALEKFVIEFEEKVKSGRYLDGEKITFQAFTERWLEEYAAMHLEATTIENYRFLLKTHILPFLGHLKLSRIQPAHLNRLYSDMLSSRKDGREGGYSPATIKRCHAVASSMLETAVRWNVITENPCKKVRPPKQARNPDNIKFFTPEQAAAFLGELDAETRSGQIQLQHNIFFQLALFCGLRRGELIALRWPDIDFDMKTLTVNKSTAIVGGKKHQKATKNRASERMVSIPGHILEMLRHYRMEYCSYRLQIGSTWVGEEYLFIQWDGSQMYPSTPNSIMKKILGRYNAENPDPLPEVTPHGLRHTSATLLISQNVDIKTVSSRLGHAQTSTTMNIYSHSLKKKDETAADALEQLLIQKKA